MLRFHVNAIMIVGSENAMDTEKITPVAQAWGWNEEMSKAKNEVKKDSGKKRMVTTVKTMSTLFC